MGWPPFRPPSPPTGRPWLIYRASEVICFLTRRNWALETIAGNAFSTLTGSVLILAFTPQSNVPVYTSLVRMLWTLVFDQG